MPDSPAADGLTRARLRAADLIGGLMEFWGFKRVLGRLWTILYLSPEPMSAAHLAEELSLSAGAVSMALGELQKWGVVRKTWRPGERRDYYEPETSIWKMVLRVFRERELGYIREAIEGFQALSADLHAERRARSGRERERVRFVEKRIDTLLAISRVGERLLTALLASGPVDLRPFQRDIEALAHPGRDRRLSGPSASGRGRRSSGPERSEGDGPTGDPSGGASS